MDIHSIMMKLVAKRPIFHNEADFQHALAWELHIDFPDAKLRLEYPIDEVSRKYIDIILINDTITYFFELKYKTRRFNYLWNDEHYILKNQGAQDLGRYDFVKDIQRLEGLKDLGTRGYAIFLTNDSSYFGRPQSDKTAYHQFRLTDGRKLSGLLRWGHTASSGTTRGREEPLNITGTYLLNWRNYNRLGKESYAEFDYLAVSI